ncbi:MAG TPA: Slp family lipoprotein [Syntrophorhabdaceae bacterium]
MKKCLLLTTAVLMLLSCSVIRKDLMSEGIRKFSFLEVMKDPGRYEGKLFILGGKIASVKLTERGSLIEAVYVPVDWTGELEGVPQPTTRFLALYPKDRGMLDPVIYKKDREITLAAFFRGIEEGKIDDMKYTFPSFVAEQVYLWEETPSVLYAPYYPWGSSYYRYPGGYWRR